MSEILHKAIEKNNVEEAKVILEMIQKVPDAVSLKFNYFLN